MKLAIVVLSVALCVASTHAEFSAEFKEKLMEKIQEVGAECAEKEKASTEDIGELLNKKLPSRKPGQCLLACINQKFGAQDDDEAGKVNMDKAKEGMTPIKAESEPIYNLLVQVMEKCFPTIGDDGDRCDKAMRLAECGQKTGKELGVPEDLFM